jgi:hypothetical protein
MPYVLGAIALFVVGMAAGHRLALDASTVREFVPHCVAIERCRTKCASEPLYASDTSCGCKP